MTARPIDGNAPATQMPSEAFAFTLNGQPVRVQAAPTQSLLDVLRTTCELKATRLGCGLGQCGACTVLLGDEAVRACETSIEAAAGRAVTTVEGLGTRAAPHPLQTAFVEEQALQCGFCTSGMLMRAAALLQRIPHPDEQQIRAALDENLCRCGVHNRVVRAVQKAAAG
jgi:nicotinate dehydrogenase subunit A